MKIERQGTHECLLASLAAVRGIPLKSVRTEACKLAGISEWTEIVYKSQEKRFWSVVKMLCEKLDIPFELLYCPIGNNSYPNVTLGSVPKEVKFLPPKGKGFIFFRAYYREHNLGQHVCPFEDGLLFDPETDDEQKRSNGETIEQWMEHKKKIQPDDQWVVQKISLL